MEAAGGPLRFKCPPDFSASLFCPSPPFSQETLQDPAKELWLIRAPANFSPESLDGHSVPLLGFQTLKAPLSGGTEKIFHIQTALEHLGGAHLLLPSGQGGCLTCSPPFSSSLSICERYGDPGGNQPLFPVAARPAPRIPAGLRQRFLPFGSNPESAPLPGAVEEPPRKKKKKMKKRHRLGEMEANSEDQPPLFGTPLGETTGAGETEARCHHEVDGAAPLAVGSQPGSTAVAQNSTLPGEPEDLAPLRKKKKKTKRKEEMGGEAEDGAAPPAMDFQPSSAADAQNGLLSGKAEDLTPLSKKKKKKKKRKEEMGGEAETGCQHEVDGAVPPAMDSQPSSAADAQNGLLSGEAEDLPPLSKKKKKKRKEDRERKEEMEAETGRQHEDGAAPPATESQPSSAADAPDGLLSGEAGEPGPRSTKRKKKKRKDDGEVKEEVGEEADSATHRHEDDGTAWGAVGPGAQPNSTAFAHDGLLSGEVEAAGPGRKKKKKREKDRELEQEARREAASPLQADGTLLWAIGSQPDPAAVAQDGLLSGEAENLAPLSEKKKREEDGETEATHPPREGEEEAAPWAIGSHQNSQPVPQEGLLSGSAEDPGPRSKKKKKRKEDRKVKEETGTEAACLPEENRTTPWEVSSQPSSGLIAQESFLSGEAESPAPISKKKEKKKKRKEGRGVEEEEKGGVAEGLPGLSSWPGGGNHPGTEEVTQGMHEKAASPELFSSQDDAAGVWRDFSSPGPVPEGEPVLAEEAEEQQQQLEVGRSSHKAKKRKKEKEKPEAAAQELGGWLAQEGAESWAEPGTPLGGGGGQEVEPGREELSQKRKKKGHRRRPVAEEGLAGLEEVGNS